MGFQKIENIKMFFETAYHRSYVFYLNEKNEIYIKFSNGDKLQSQVMRGFIADDVGLDAYWDWKKFWFEENITKTIDKVKKQLREKFDVGIKYVYYCRAIDGMTQEEVRDEYLNMEYCLNNTDLILVNSVSKDTHTLYDATDKNTFNEYTADMIVTENLNNITKADCVLVNLTIKNHLYVGCIAEMVYAKLKGCFIIVVAGDSGADKYFYTLYHADVIVYSLEEALRIINTCFQKDAQCNIKEC